MSKSRIVIAEPLSDSATTLLRTVGEVTVLSALDTSTLTAAVRESDAMLVRTNTQVNRELLAHAPQLRVIGRAGVGLDNIDLEAARERNIQVVYTPAASTDAVADLTIGLILAVERQIALGASATRAGRFAEARVATLGRELCELTIGIVGMGRIWRAVARRCRDGFGMTVLFNDIVEPGWLGFSATPVDKPTLFSNSDVVSLHVPLTGETRGMIGATALAGFKSAAILINTARGAVVDSDALAAALSAGRLGGAGLDVTEPEPLPQGHALWSASNLVITPHVGAKTHRAQARMNAVAEDVARVLQGQPPLFPALAEHGR